MWAVRCRMGRNKRRALTAWLRRDTSPVVARRTDTRHRGYSIQLPRVFSPSYAPFRTLRRNLRRACSFLSCALLPTMRRGAATRRTSTCWPPPHRRLARAPRKRGSTARLSSAGATSPCAATPTRFAVSLAGKLHMHPRRTARGCVGARVAVASTAGGVRSPLCTPLHTSPHLAICFPCSDAASSCHALSSDAGRAPPPGLPPRGLRDLAPRSTYTSDPPSRCIRTMETPCCMPGRRRALERAPHSHAPREGRPRAFVRPPPALARLRASRPPTTFARPVGRSS